jgi:hypothetical protein
MIADAAAPSPFTHPVGVETIRQRGTPVLVRADAAALPGIAAALDLASLEALEGRLTLTRDGSRVRLEGVVEAALHQTCIVTLEPFSVALSVPVALDFLPEAELAELAARSAKDEGEGVIDIEVRLNEEDPPEAIVDGVIDLGAVMLEFLALSLDPYPRKPGAAFESPEPDVLLQSPFAALARLKRDE